MTNKQETKYFIVNYEDADNNIINRIILLVDETYESIVKRFELKEDTDKFSFYLCPDVQTYIHLTGKTEEEYQEWMVGNADYRKKQLCILSPNVVNDRSFEEMLSVVQHEIIHIAFDQLQNADDANIFVAEGIAVAMANQIYINALSDTDYPEAKKLTDEDYFYENGGYLYSGVYILHFLKRNGIETFKKVYAGEKSFVEYLYDGFEKDAIQSLLASVQ